MVLFFFSGMGLPEITMNFNQKLPGLISFNFWKATECFSCRTSRNYHEF